MRKCLRLGAENAITHTMGYTWIVAKRTEDFAWEPLIASFDRPEAKSADNSQNRPVLSVQVSPSVLNLMQGSKLMNLVIPGILERWLALAPNADCLHRFSLEPMS